jgi:hypothetical protein
MSSNPNATVTTLTAQNVRTNFLQGVNATLNNLTCNSIITGGYTPFTYYEEYTDTPALTGLTDVTTITVKIIRVGKNVTVQWYQNPTSGTATGTGVISVPAGSIPTRFITPSALSQLVLVQSAGAAATGLANFGTDGSITFYSSVSLGTFSGASIIYGGSVNYNMN